MAESHVVCRLVEKRTTLAGELCRLRMQTEAIAASLSHIDATILIFAPDFCLDDIQPKGLPRNNPWFANGELSRFALDALRQASEPLSTRQLGEIMANRKGVTPQTGDDWDRLLKSVLGALQRFERRSIVRMTRGKAGKQRNGMLWELV